MLHVVDGGLKRQFSLQMDVSLSVFLIHCSEERTLSASGSSQSGACKNCRKLRYKYRRCYESMTAIRALYFELQQKKRGKAVPQPHASWATPRSASPVRSPPAPPRPDLPGCSSPQCRRHSQESQLRMSPEQMPRQKSHDALRPPPQRSAPSRVAAASDSWHTAAACCGNSDQSGGSLINNRQPANARPPCARGPVGTLSPAQAAITALRGTARALLAHDSGVRELPSSAAVWNTTAQAGGGRTESTRPSTVVHPAPGCKLTASNALQPAATVQYLDKPAAPEARSLLPETEDFVPATEPGAPLLDPWATAPGAVAPWQFPACPPFGQTAAGNLPESPQFVPATEASPPGAQCAWGLLRGDPAGKPIAANPTGSPQFIPATEASPPMCLGLPGAAAQPPKTWLWPPPPFQESAHAQRYHREEGVAGTPLLNAGAYEAKAAAVPGLSSAPPAAGICLPAPSAAEAGGDASAVKLEIGSAAHLVSSCVLAASTRAQPCQVLPPQPQPPPAVKQEETSGMLEAASRSFDRPHSPRLFGLPQKPQSPSRCIHSSPSIAHAPLHEHEAAGSRRSDAAAAAVAPGAAAVQLPAVQQAGIGIMDNFNCNRRADHSSTDSGEQQRPAAAGAAAAAHDAPSGTSTPAAACDSPSNPALSAAVAVSQPPLPPTGLVPQVAAAALDHISQQQLLPPAADKLPEPVPAGYPDCLRRSMSTHVPDEPPMCSVAAPASCMDTGVQQQGGWIGRRPTSTAAVGDADGATPRAKPPPQVMHGNSKLPKAVLNNPETTVAMLLHALYSQYSKADNFLREFLPLGL